MSWQAAGWLLFAGISVYAVLLTVFDKARARRHGWRVPEAHLLWAAAFGGAAAMLLTMLLIRHKTRHAKFMLGLPALIALHLGFLLLLLYALHLPPCTLLPGG